MRRYIPYSEAKKYISHGDILLFRGKGTISKFLSKAADSEYTHTGFAAVNSEDYITCVEMREFVGGREVNLKTQVRQHSGYIDVFKPRTPISTFKFTMESGHLIQETELVHYNANKVVACARELTGEQYGWDKIWWLAKRHLPFIRLWVRGDLSDFDDELVQTGPMSYVCSTLVAHCVRNHWVDLLHMVPDHAMEPGDVARSTAIQYAFTIYFDGDEEFEKLKS